MKTYLANRVVGNVFFCVEIEADSWDDAELLCAKNDMELLGEKYDEVECEDEMIAMIEKSIHHPRLH